LDLLASVVDKSLVNKEDIGNLACYRLHETMREYGSLKLREAGEVEVTGRRCGAYYRSRCQRSELQARHRLAEWLEWMELEIDNVRAVLWHCLDRADLSLGIDLASSLYWYWVTRATAEGVRWLDQLLASEQGTQSSHAFAYYMRGFLANLQANPSSARPWFERAAATARASGDVALLSRALSQASIAENMAGQRLPARHLLDEAEAVAVALDDVDVRLGLLQARTLNAFFVGDLDAAKSAITEGVRLSREADEPYRLEMMLMNLGSAALMAGDVDAAKPVLTESLRIARSIDDRIAQYYLLDALGCHAAGIGKARLAAQLLGAAETVRTGAGARMIPTIAPLIDVARESAVAALGQSKFEKEFEAGMGLTRAGAIGLALGEPTSVAPAATDGAGATPLGKRQAEVARLVADGLSNKQIGARLFISEHTVDSHVRSILNKLGFNSRVQIAAWMASSQH
jgi:DNA-binding CsgD family transcriptional regulator